MLRLDLAILMGNVLFAEKVRLEERRKDFSTS